MARSTTPLPEVTRTGDRVEFGKPDLRDTFERITIGTETLYVGVKTGNVFDQCGKCSGRGILPHYAGIFNGVCFACTGSGRHALTWSKERVDIEGARKVIRRRIVAAANRARKEAAKAAELAAAFPKWAAEHAETLTALAEFRHDWMTDPYGQPRDEFLAQLASRVEAGQILTDKQLAAAKRAMTEIAEQEAADAAKLAAERYAGEENDRVTVTGTVQFVKGIEGQVQVRPGYWKETYKRLVVIAGTGDDAGITLKMFSTANAVWELELGDTVTVTATVTGHEVYNEDTKQTVVARPKITGRVPAPAPSDGTIRCTEHQIVAQP